MDALLEYGLIVTVDAVSVVLYQRESIAIIDGFTTISCNQDGS